MSAQAKGGKPKAAILRAWDTVCMAHFVVWLIGLCLVGSAAAIVGWHRLDDWCAGKLEAAAPEE